MSGPPPYLFLDGTAAEALHAYHAIFGGDLAIHTFADFGRDDGPGDAVAHGILTGPVSLFAADVAGDQEPLHVRGLQFSLLGTADPQTLTRWFDALAQGGRVIDPLQERPWGASDGQVEDRFGLQWLIGFEPG